MTEDRLGKARLTGSFAAHYAGFREWFPSWFDSLGESDREFVFDMMVDRRQQVIDRRKERRRTEVEEAKAAFNQKGE